MGVADMISRAYGSSEHSKERAMYQDLKNPVYKKIVPPSNLLGYPISCKKFNELINPYLAEFRQKYANELSVDEDQNTPSADNALTKKDKEGMGREVAPPTEEVEHISFVADIGNAPKLDAQLFCCAQKRDKLFDRLKDPWLVHNILYTKQKTETGLQTVLVVPSILRPLVPEHYHGITKGPHFGQKKLFATLRQYFWWPGMAKQVAQYCRDCVQCKFETPKTGPKAPLRRWYRPTRPNDVINIDIVGPYPQLSCGMKYVLMMQCDFSKFVCVVPLPDKTSAHVV